MVDAPRAYHEIVLCFDTTALAKQLAELSPETLDELSSDSSAMSLEFFVAEWTPAVGTDGPGKLVYGIRLAPDFQQAVSRPTSRTTILDDDIGHDDRS
ncbi:MAG: hypothetical protein ACHQRJ_18715 [Alphaproteobacteria bacterium]